MSGNAASPYIHRQSNIIIIGVYDWTMIVIVECSELLKWSKLKKKTATTEKVYRHRVKKKKVYKEGNKRVCIFMYCL